ncbi:MAG: hypothetical protein HZC28_00720 [Spirochaetes bacterium]|nr:hypothetical protein [Spirochaetota bacterium]
MIRIGILTLVIAAALNAVPIKFFLVGIPSSGGVVYNENIPRLLESFYETAKKERISEGDLSFTTSGFTKYAYLSRYFNATISTTGLAVIYMNGLVSSGQGFPFLTYDSAGTSVITAADAASVIASNTAAVLLLLDTPTSTNVQQPVLTLPEIKDSFLAAFSGKPHAVIAGNAAMPNAVISNLIEVLHTHSGVDAEGKDGIISVNDIYQSFPASMRAGNALGEYGNEAIAVYQWVRPVVSVTTNAPAKSSGNVKTRNFVVYSRNAVSAQQTANVTTNITPGYWK